MSSYFSDYLSSNIFGDKYQIERELASRGGRKTLLAKNIEQNTLVVIKLLTFSNEIVWDDFKLFEREAETLKSLSHPAIPQYLDYLEIDTEQIKGYALVQSCISATSLADQIESGRSFSELEVKELAQAILEILEYLHSRQPPVIHRDIKPSNILLGDRSGNSVGQAYLIDFGSVQNVATKNSSTITVVGTYGYMPPEQFGGRVKPASDLYSLGAALIYLLTGKHPADLPETDLKIEFEEFCHLSPGLINWLKQITNPSLSKRFTSATQALAELAACENYQGQENRKFVQPPNSKIILRQNGDFWEAIMPPKNFHWQKKMNTIQILLFCWLPYLIIIIALLMGIPLETILEQSIQYLGIGAIATFVAVVLSYQFLKPMLTTKRLKIDSSGVILIEQVFSLKSDYIFARGKNTLEKLEINTFKNVNNLYSSLNIYLAGDKFELVNNHDYPVTSLDIDWFAEELSIWLNIPIIKSGINKRINNTGVSERTAQQVDLYIKKAYEFYSQAYYEKAIENCDSALELNPNRLEGYFIRGAAHCYSGNHQIAMSNFHVNTILEPSARNYYNLAAIQFTQGMYSDALKSFNSCIKLDDRFKFADQGN